MSHDRMILGKERLRVETSAELKDYYERKYASGGYRGGGCVVQGYSISERYHSARHDTALRLFDPQPGDRILDAGCGDGAFCSRLVGLCREVIGVDIAENAVAPGNRLETAWSFSPMDLEHLDFPADSFDRIVSIETLEHVLHPDAALHEIHRVLKPGGRFVLTYPTINTSLVKRLRLGRRIPISEHLNEWTLPELDRRLTTAGFKRTKRWVGIAFDFGLLNGLKAVHPWAARVITELALKIRIAPSNSMFVAGIFTC